MKNIFKLYLTMTLCMAPIFAMSKSIDLTFSPLDQISKNRYLHQQNIQKAKLLLKSTKMDQSFSLALTEVLDRKVRPSKNFTMIQIKFREAEAFQQKKLIQFIFFHWLWRACRVRKVRRNLLE
ncbi:hypothetical protein MJH12_05935 [bacterium]|nr:hypothetical protein [bacterium]